jgi:hypothetical protein
MTITPPEANPLAPHKRLVMAGDGKLFLCAFAANPQAGGYLRPCLDDSQVALLGLIAGTHAGACMFDLDVPGLSGLATGRELKHNRVLPLAFAIPQPDV